MEKGSKDGKTSGPTFLPDATASSRFLYRFQEMIHPVNANVPFVDKRVLRHKTDIAFLGTREKRRV